MLEAALLAIVANAPTTERNKTGDENDFEIEDIGAHNKHRYLANIARKALGHAG